MQHIDIKVETSPYIRKDTSTKRMMIDVLIALTPVVFFSIYKFGLSALLRMLVSIVSMVGFEVLYIILFKKVEPEKTYQQTWMKRMKSLTINNITAPMVSGLIFSLLLPDQVSYYVIVIGSFFGIIVGKMIFGGLGHNLFNPAAFGRVFVGLSLTALMGIGVYSQVDGVSGATSLAIGFPEVFASYSLKDMFFGNIPGSLGETSSLAILIGGIYLLIRRSADFRPVIATLLSFTILIIIAGFILYPNDVLKFTLYHLFTGGLLFGVFFMVTDPVTSPITRPGRFIFGLIIGALIFAIRMFGAYPEGVAMAILVANLFVPLIDYPKWATNQYTKKFFIGYALSFVCIILLSVWMLGGFGL
ncbi:MAG: RnfABCDGE type electron transport complex subunit D [Candidatus Phytoplasma sp.]|nr:RnfABCDGE type electron transport complex subunit D [Phytoplasma sp.]